MTASTEQERAEFEANELESGRVVCINGIGGRYTDPIQQASWESWQAARRAPVVPKGWQELDAKVMDELLTLETDAHYIFNNPPGECQQDVRDVIEWYASSVRQLLAAQEAK